MVYEQYEAHYALLEEKLARNPSSKVFIALLGQCFDQIKDSKINFISSKLYLADKHPDLFGLTKLEKEELSYVLDMWIDLYTKYKTKYEELTNGN